MPKFRIDTKTELQTMFEKSGIETVFDIQKADFSPLFGNIAPGRAWVSEIKHAATVMVDENGFEGAAATASVISTRSLAWITK